MTGIKQHAPHLFLWLLCALLCSVPTHLAAQKGNPEKVLVTQNYRSQDLKAVLTHLGQTYNLRFAFDDQRARQIQVNQSFSNTPVPRVLEQLLANSGLTFKLLDGAFLIIPQPSQSPKGAALSESSGQANPATANQTGIKPTVQLSGVVIDAATGEPLPFANVVLASANQGTSTDVDGRFTLYKVPQDTVQLLCSYIGYRTLRQPLKPAPGTQLTLTLYRELHQLKEIIVKEPHTSFLQASPEAAKVTIDPLQIGKLPSIGQKDVFKTLQLMPGVQGTEESFARLNIRGGTADQNLVLLDGFTVYQLDHFFGVFSALNPNAVKNLQVYKGGFDARYGGRASAVIDITGFEGNRLEPTAHGSVSLLSADAGFSAPLFKKLTLALNYRRSLTDAIQTQVFNNLFSSIRTNVLGNGEVALDDEEFDDIEPSFVFYDLNAKLTYRPNQNNVLAVSLFGSQDDLSFNKFVEFELPRTTRTVTYETQDISAWSNGGFSLRWSSQLTSRLQTRLQLVSTTYNSTSAQTEYLDWPEAVQNQEDFGFSFERNNEVQDASLQLDASYRISANTEYQFGVGATGYNTLLENTFDSTETFDLATEASLVYTYHQLNGHLGPLQYTAGLRVTNFNEDERWLLAPRLRLSYPVTNKLTLKGAWGTYNQFMQRLSQNRFSNTDQFFWVMADSDLEVPIIEARHTLLGAVYTQGPWTLELEAYNKYTNGVILTEYAWLQDALEDDFDEAGDPFYYTGETRAQGLDLMLQRRKGRYTGWISYSLSNVRNRVPILNRGQYYPTNIDQRHELKLVNVYTANRWNLGATWIYGTGKPYTLPNPLRPLDQPFDFRNVNSERLPAYHRLDLSAQYSFPLGDGQGTLGISLFNVYNRSNIRSLRFGVIREEVEEDDPDFNEEQPFERSLERIELRSLGFTPNLSFEVRF